MKKSNIFVVVLLVLLLIIGGYFGWTKYQEKVANDKQLTQKSNEEPGYLKYRPKEAIVSFYLESDNTENSKLGEKKEVTLKINTNNEEIKKFRSVFKYYARRMTFISYKLNPEFADLVKVDLDKERGYVTIQSDELIKPKKGDFEVVKFEVELSEEGLGFFDLVNGDLEAINLDNENIANIQDVKSIQVNIKNGGNE